MALTRKGEDWYIDYYANGKRKREKIEGNAAAAARPEAAAVKKGI